MNDWNDQINDWQECRDCGDDFPTDRARLGYTCCMRCGEARAREERTHWCIAPMHKSNYMLFTNPADLIGINNKGGLVK